MAERNEIRPGWRGHNITEAVTILLRAIIHFIPLSERECNGFARMNAVAARVQ